MAYWVPITVAGAQCRAVDRARTLLSQNFPLPFVYRLPSACRRHHLFFWELWAVISSQWPGLVCGSVVEHLLDVQKATVPCIQKKIPALLGVGGGVFVGLLHLSYLSVCLCVCPSICATLSWYYVSIVSLKSGWHDLSLRVCLFCFVFWSFVFHFCKHTSSLGFDRDCFPVHSSGKKGQLSVLGHVLTPMNMVCLSIS